MPGKSVKRSVFHRNRKEQEASKPVIEAQAVARYIRLSPRKARSIVNAIRGKDVGEAFQILEFTPTKPARVAHKVLKSAVANAENNFGMNVDALYVSEAVVDDGPRMKRLWARGRGRADILLKRFCHLKIAVRDREREEAENSPQEKEERGE